MKEYLRKKLSDLGNGIKEFLNTDPPFVHAENCSKKQGINYSIEYQTGAIRLIKRQCAECGAADSFKEIIDFHVGW